MLCLLRLLLTSSHSFISPTPSPPSTRSRSANRIPSFPFRIKPFHLSHTSTSQLPTQGQAMTDHKPYIVIFKSDAPQSAIDEQKAKIKEQGGTLKQVFDSEIMRGFSATMPQAFAQDLTTASLGGKHEHIEYVEPDSEVKTL
ncbi:hypothetical protein IE53DRAFT_383562 [Violaceomyces palustris]|uniref:Uncharacterized protein n=1 Tax=Violaceomyces palustris TaxID=1673888 RepID=A0ACD0P798_9BASI|nr:hypothetical protein IE53DRAFT_383562 [Violaceomyces palustris]